MIFSSELSLIIHQSCLMLDGHFMLKAFFLFTTMKQISVNKVKFSTLTSVQFERKVWLIASHHFADETLDCDKSLFSLFCSADTSLPQFPLHNLPSPPPPSLPPQNIFGMWKWGSRYAGVEKKTLSKIRC